MRELLKRLFGWTWHMERPPVPLPAPRNPRMDGVMRQMERAFLFGKTEEWGRLIPVPVFRGLSLCIEVGDAMTVTAGRRVCCH